MDLKDKGQYEEAIAAFEELGDYKDCDEQIDSCQKLMIKQTLCPTGKVIVLFNILGCCCFSCLGIIKQISRFLISEIVP